MSKYERPMILAYWRRVAGSLIEEFELVKGDGTSDRAQHYSSSRLECARIIGKGYCHLTPTGGDGH